MKRGQSLIELAICAPIVALLAVAAVAAAQLADARAGLEAAAQAAVAAAARAPDPQTAGAVAAQEFAAVTEAYPLRGCAIHLSLGDFSRGGTLDASATASVDLAAGGMFGLPARVTLHVVAASRIEPWRSRGSTL